MIFQIAAIAAAAAAGIVWWWRDGTIAGVARWMGAADGNVFITKAFTAALIPAVTFIACSSTHALQLDALGTSVELDMYSGRPNPVWQLTAEETAQLEARLSGLPEATGSTSDRLGYRGFVIRPRSRSEIRVYAGSIFHENSVYADVHDAEAWLAAYAERKGVTVQR